MNITDISDRIEKAAKRYGEFSSTHEALGVALEEWNEFCDAVRSNDFIEIKSEALDLAAVLIRLVREINSSEKLRKNSVK